jgi:aryl-alcohol dehydrogenase-like predicted oxidoreductase
MSFSPDAHAHVYSDGLTRAQILRMAVGLSASTCLHLATYARTSIANPTMNTRPIPSTNEALPVIGCGTWVGFDHAPGSTEYQRLPGVLDALFDAGGTLLDSSPMYGRAEQTTGELLAASKNRAKAFLATKVWTRGREAGIAQMEQSFAHLKAERIDLMQVHNLVDWRMQLATLRDWKASGRIRYIGITHYTASALGDVEAVLRAEQLDFLQINYSIDDREVEKRLLPLAAERGVAVIVNQPFGGGGLLRGLRNRPLPGWASEIGCTSWAQVLLKFTLSHPAVTCVIPGTGRPEHMADNAAAGLGQMPDAAFWKTKAASVIG